MYLIAGIPTGINLTKQIGGLLGTVTKNQSWRINMGMPGIWELVIIFLIILVVFGAGKIPKIARDIGSGIKEFKKSLNGKDENEQK